MEFYTQDEFVDHFTNNTKLPEEDIKIIFRSYWELPALTRFENNTNDWIEFINKTIS